MKIEFSELLGTCSCNFNGGGKRTHIDGSYEPEKHGCFLDFLGELATKALDAAIEQERSEMTDKVFNDIMKESKDAITNYIGFGRYRPLRVAEPTNKTNYWQQGLCPKQNPYIVGGVKAKVERMQPKIEKVIFSCPATIVFWSDGDKTVVKATNELFDREKGLAMAISKKFLGNKGNYFDTFKKYIK